MPQSGRGLAATFVVGREVEVVRIAEHGNGGSEVASGVWWERLIRRNMG
jgi:hypothetical protein